MAQGVHQETIDAALAAEPPYAAVIDVRSPAEFAEVLAMTERG